MAENLREIVLDTLLEIEKATVYSNQVIKAVLDKFDYLKEQEKRFIKRLAEGCVERRIELDYILNEYSTVPVKKMKPTIRCLMRMGVYQILYMDSVPDSAACNEAVKLAGKRKFVNLKGFVNGVLRKIAAQKDNIPLPDEDAEPVRALSVQYSMPEWIVELWLE
ncbi:MAG: 16S rRNA (cytosine(967)-C(5))-methyltransferase, partial [Acetatifactor sp.]|nr:16S rRNA (cytosine(967)-C(5))-methyltransferase [Acetatifactor sp.]